MMADDLLSTRPRSFLFCPFLHFIFLLLSTL